MRVMGRVNDYVNMLRLKKLGNDRINNVALPKGKAAEDSALRAQAAEQAKASKIGNIVAKLKAGMKLTVSELEYLREHSPETYQKAVKIAKERDDYKQRLRKCKSKEEAQRLHTEKLQQLSNEAGTVRRMNVGQAEKQGMMETIGMRMAAIQNELQTFVAKGGIARLPRQRELERKRDEAERVRDRRDDEQALDRADEKRDRDDPDTVGDTKVDAEIRLPGEKGVGEGEKAALPGESAAEFAMPGRRGREGVSGAADASRQTDAARPAAQKPDAEFSRRKKAVSAYKKAVGN